MSFEQKLLLKKQIKANLERLKKELTCQVCLGVFRDPQTLSCSHSYCKLCIKQLLQSSKEKGKFACPQCRRLTSRREANHEDLMLAKLVTKLHEFWDIMPEEIGCDALTQNTQYYDNYTVPTHMRFKHKANTNHSNNNDTASDSPHSLHSHISDMPDINELDSNMPASARRVTFNHEDDVHTLSNDKEPENAQQDNNEPLYAEEDLHAMSQNRLRFDADNMPMFSLDPDAEHMDYTLDLDLHTPDNDDLQDNNNSVGHADDARNDIHNNNHDISDIYDANNDDMDVDEEAATELEATLNPTMSMADIADIAQTNNNNVKNKKTPLPKAKSATKEIKSLSVTVSTRSRRKSRKKRAATSRLLQSKSFMSTQCSQIVFDHENENNNDSKPNENESGQESEPEPDRKDKKTPLKTRKTRKKSNVTAKRSKKQRDLSKLEKIGLKRTDFIEGDFCAVCCMNDVDDTAVYCDGCDVLVHMECYGIISAPSKSEEWFCDPCKRDLSLHKNGVISCVICLTDIDCAYKVVLKSNKWAHTSCALWLTGVNFVNKQTLSPISIDAIDPDRYKLRCLFCKKRGGACLQCELCTHSYHVPCAHRGTAHLELREHGERVYFHSFCPLHADEVSRNSVPDNNHDYPVYPRKNIRRGRKRKRDESESDGESDGAGHSRSRSKSSPSKRKKTNNKNSNGYRARSKSEGNYNKNNNPQIFRSPDVRKYKLSDSAPVILCSGLDTKTQIDDYNKFKSKFGDVATFTTQWKNNVTHLVTAATIKKDKRKLSSRTIKYFQSVIAGSWVVCFDWIKECLSNNTLLNERKYEVVADQRGEGACKKSRELRQKNINDGGLFANIICVIASEFQYVKLDEDLRCIFRMGGATIRKMLPYQWLKDIGKYQKEMNGKQLIFVYDKQQTEMTAKQLDFAAKFGVLTIGYQEVFNAISNYKPIA